MSHLVSPFLRAVTTIVLAVTAVPPIAAQSSATALDLPWRRVVLPNGLTLLMLPDSTVAAVAVQVWLRGGAREEVAGQHGISHLFEHDLPFAGRFFTAENRALRSRTTLNTGAGTDYDFLRFYADVRPEGLEATLGGLADRIESDSANFSEVTLERDKDIVMGEVRRSTSIDSDLDVVNLLALGTFGVDHPYNHAVIGREGDIRAATATLMRDWHRRFASASNALVILVGNFDPGTAEVMVRRQFGSIRPGMPLPRVTRWIPRARERRDILEKDVQRGVVYLRWPIPNWGDTATVDLALLAETLGARSSGDALDSLTAEVDLMEVAGAFTLRGVVARNASADDAEVQMRAHLAQLLRDGPTQPELVRVRAREATTFVLSLQTLGGRRDRRTDAIGLGEFYRNDPDRWRVLRRRGAAATKMNIRDAGRRWLSEPGYSLHVVPRATGIATAIYDRATPVTPAPVRRPAIPRITERSLAGGMRLIVVERPSLPLAEITLAFDAGTGTDTPENAGRARVALDALTRLPVDARGTTLGDALTESGGRLETQLDHDYAVLSISLLSDDVAPAIRLLASALQRPAPANLLGRATHDARQRLDVALSDPMQSRSRVMGCLMLVPCDAAALDGLGTRSGLAQVTPAVLREFYRTHYRPAATALIVSGRVDSSVLERQLTTALAGWARGSAAVRTASAVKRATARDGAAAIVDYPLATQTHVLLAQPLPPEFATDPAKRQLALIINFAFRQRLMANLRESKGWSYEVYPFTVEVNRQGAFMLYNIPLQPDKVGETIGEIRKELLRMRDDSLSAEFLATVAAAAASASVLRDLSSLQRVNADVLELARSGQSAAAYVEAQRALGTMTPADLRSAVQSMLDPSRQFWVFAGRIDGVRAELAEVGLTPVETPP